MVFDRATAEKYARQAREAGERALAAGQKGQGDVAQRAVAAGKKSLAAAEALEAALKVAAGAPNDADLDQVTRDAEAAAGEADSLVPLLAPVGGARAILDILDTMVGAAKPDVGRVLAKAGAASQRAIDLGKRAIKAGKKKAGERAIAAGNRAAASAKKLTDAVAKAKAQVKQAKPGGQSQAKPAQAQVQAQQAKPAQAQAKPVQAKSVAQTAKPLAKKIAIKGDGPILKTALPGIATDEQWTQFAHALRAVDENGEPVPADAVSPSNELGMFALKPRRLADLDIVMNIERTKAPNGRMVWIADFVPPLTLEIFLAKPRVQYAALVRSIRDYVQKLRDKSIPAPDGGKPPEMTLSGALAILQKCGPSGLRTWNDVEKRFPSTAELYERTNGCF